MYDLKSEVEFLSWPSYIPTDNDVADVFTKPVTGAKLDRLVGQRDAVSPKLCFSGGVKIQIKLM